MKKAAAIITNRGGRTCHAAIVSRELGLPAVVGTERGTEILRHGENVTVSCSQGDAGFVYDGILDFEVRVQDLHKLERPKTHIMMNVGNPEEAFRLSFIPNDGVGLGARRFHYFNVYQIHPMALIIIRPARGHGRSGRDRPAYCGLYGQAPVLCRQARAGSGNDGRGILSQGRDRTVERFQDE